MQARYFWLVSFICYCIQETLWVLFGMGVLPDIWMRILSGTIVWTLFFGMFIEEWRVNPTQDTATRWHSEMVISGVIYVIPLMLAMVGRVNHLFVVLSIVAFPYFVWRLVRLRMRLLPQGEIEE